MWREAKNTDMNSNKLRFYDASDAIRTFVEYQTTMNAPQGYDYSEALVADTTGRTFGIDEYLTLKNILQEAAKDMPYEIWAMLIDNVINDRSVRSMETTNTGARRKISAAKRMVEQCLRKRDMLHIKLEAM